MSDDTKSPQSKVKEFLEVVPPGVETGVTNLGIHRLQFVGLYLNTPALQLHCENEQCNGMRNFGCANDGPNLKLQKVQNEFLTYVCRNCHQYTKTYALAAYLENEAGAGIIYKYGETPSFGPPTPNRVLTLLGDNRSLFLAGRRAENQGMGIGAFVYYRRVVEVQKNKIFDEIIKVVRKIDPADPILKELEDGKQQTQFSRSVEQIKHALPQSLLINNTNPLSLLHSALSQGVHAMTDADCLELATNIRIVLVEFIRRLSQSLRDEAELNAAVAKLSQAKKNCS